MSHSPYAPATATGNPAGWPAELLPVFEKFKTCEFTSLTGRGVPITLPLTPYVGEDGLTLDVSTGLTYPAKAERVRRNPRVSILYSHGTGSGIPAPPAVLVQGLASVHDADLQANTDRYVRESFAKLPEAARGMPGFLLRQLGWYYARIWIQVTPLRIQWWPAGHIDAPPRLWEAPEGTGPRPSDPAPAGKQPAAWAEPPADWRGMAAGMVQRLGAPVMTTVGTDGYPVSVRASSATLDGDGFRLHLGAGLPSAVPGPACLTFHAHPEAFTGQENKTFLGEVTAAGHEVVFRVDKLLADWSLTGNRLTKMFGFMAKGRVLRPRMEAEAARRGQPVPRVNLPR